MGISFIEPLRIIFGRFSCATQEYIGRESCSISRERSLQGIDGNEESSSNHKFSTNDYSIRNDNTC